ncbi:MAG: Uma2 family endonuclease [Blastocatellia bacterium]
MSHAVIDPPERRIAVRKTLLTIRLRPVIEMSDEQFFEFCQLNRDLRFERTAEGDIIVMPPTGWETGNRNAEITAQLRNWSKDNKAGVSTDSSTGFKLPGGADRSPDAAWVRRERLAQLTQEQKRKFLPLCPDFVIELLSPTDDVNDLQAKMQEYISNGAQLGWLIEPENRRVYVYRPGAEVEVIENAEQISGEPELPGFTLELSVIWEPNI